MNKKEYTILQDPDTFNLSLSVTQYLNDGWELVGGVIITPVGRDGQYLCLQALVRTKES